MRLAQGGGQVGGNLRGFHRLATDKPRGGLEARQPRRGRDKRRVPDKAADRIVASGPEPGDGAEGVEAVPLDEHVADLLESTKRLGRGIALQRSPDEPPPLA